MSMAASPADAGLRRDQQVQQELRSASIRPVGGWRRALADCALVGGATAVGHALGALTSLVLRLALAPAQMGVWQGLKLCLSYGNYAGLGVSKAAAREVSLATGSGATATCQRATNLAFTVNTITSALYAGGLAATALWTYFCGQGEFSRAWAYGLGAVAALTMLQRSVTFRVTLLRSRRQFAACSTLSLQEAVLTLALAGGAAWCWGLPGLLSATAAVMLASWWFLQRRAPIRFRFAWDGNQIKAMIALGGPLLLAGIASSLFRSLDRWMILGFLSDGEFQLGCYSLGLMVSVQLFGLANVLAGVMTPRYAELLGKTGVQRDVAALVARTTELQSLLLALPAALALVVGPPLLARLLPEYQSGISTLVPLVLGTLAIGIALPASGYLTAIGDGRRLLVCFLFVSAAAALGNHAALSQGGGIAGVAWAMATASGLFLLLLYRVSVWPLLTTKARVRCVMNSLFALVPTLGLALAGRRLLPERADAPTAAAGLAITVIVVWAATLWSGWNWAGWRAARE